MSVVIRYAMLLSMAVVTVSSCVAHPCQRDSCQADREITRSVNRLLLNYPSLQAPNTVRVETVNRVVYLYGQVDNEVERSTAQQAAQSVPGVARVVNSISFAYEGR
jgi:osmotically-inducible protein OsmY